MRVTNFLAFKIHIPDSVVDPNEEPIENALVDEANIVVDEDAIVVVGIEGLIVLEDASKEK